MKELNLILGIIEALIYTGGKLNFAILPFGEYYIQMVAGRGDYEIYCEAISNNSLDSEDYLNESQMRLLKKLNWNEPQNSEGNYYLTHSVDSEKGREDLSHLILVTSKIVYGSNEIMEENVIFERE